MSGVNILRSLHTLPVELVYRIFDNLDPFTILISLRNVCTKLNAITDSYRPYQVNFMVIFKLNLIPHRQDCGVISIE
jgi:hypothetical protein